MKVHNVLVVDDDETTRNLLLAVLRQAGFAADAAASGHEALSRLDTTNYSAVVLDVMMPGISGIEIIRQLASTGRHTKCVVLMSAGTESLLDDAPPALIHTKLRKPFNIKDVVEAVRGCVESLGTWGGAFRQLPGQGAAADVDVIGYCASPHQRTTPCWGSSCRWRAGGVGHIQGRRGLN